jgi:presenilin-like A22 family membrane protease
VKHNIKITAVLIAMFIITQFIGLAVINFYTPKYQQVEINGTIQNITTNPLPYNMAPPEDINKNFSPLYIAISMAIAVALIFLLMTIKASWFLRLWFFIVVIIALGVSFNSFFSWLNIPYSEYLVLILAIPLAFIKVFRRSMLIHNLTELLIYPGIAVVLVPILNIWTAIILLILISIYDIYAVWHSGFMQKMAKFQINELKFFAGFFVPYIPKNVRLKMQNMKKSDLKNKKVKVSLAILGGGDVVFPIIVSGVVLRTLGFLPALAVTLCASLALLGVFIFARKGRFYPAMPFITAGCFIGLLIAWLITLI